MPVKFVTTPEEWEEATGLKLEASVQISPAMPSSLRKSQQPETTDVGDESQPPKDGIKGARD